MIASCGRQPDCGSRQRITGAFPDGSTEQPSEALPAICDNWDEFVKIFNDFVDYLAQIAMGCSRPRIFCGSISASWANSSGL